MLALSSLSVAPSSARSSISKAESFLLPIVCPTDRTAPSNRSIRFGANSSAPPIALVMSSKAAFALLPSKRARSGSAIKRLPTYFVPLTTARPVPFTAPFVAPTAALGNATAGSNACAAAPTRSAAPATRPARRAVSAAPTALAPRPTALAPNDAPLAATDAPPASIPKMSNGRSCSPRPVNSYSSPTLSNPAEAASPWPNCSATRLFSGL